MITEAQYPEKTQGN